MVYHSHLESHMNYGLLIWGNNASKDQLNKLQRIQTECLKLVARKNKSGNLNKELGILSISSKIMLQNCKFRYKLKNKQLPNKTLALCHLDSKNKSLTKQHKYQTRHKELPNLPRNMNKTYRNSFLSMGPKSFQALPVETELRPTIKSFTFSCKKYLLSHMSWHLVTCWNKWKHKISSKWKPHQISLLKQPFDNYRTTFT